MIRLTTGLMTLAALAACSTPNAPTVSAAGVGRSFEEARAIADLPLTSVHALPTGTVTYNGQLGADVSGDLSGSILSDMRMVVGFGDNSIGGTVSNINLIDPDGRPNQRFDGTLIIDGAEDDGMINAFASGDITGVNAAGFRVDSNLLLTLEGDVVDDIGHGDAVFGTARGTGIGDLEIALDGVFFGTAD